ncbi:uncharacterized protein BHQ10_002148 [Talaromyces amestolkiae]|uniref:25S rRNA (Uridine(2843)-N(3))-methyltransferase n=1 Tax=Talaromyces amestolkiae TaxID=1196081 RepID=A0A364KRG2_TALAM|nr:uncharacterized protein BHQ10_002148 [Talaromyces amestolkiae]RAO66136.1 hypothetical protein BHQ10_002148 [Talaromyces amestolkiae]
MGGGGNGKEKWKVGPTKKRGSPQRQKQAAKKTPPSSRKEYTTTAVNNDHKMEDENEHIDLSASAKRISPDLQQLLLNVFKYALFSSLEQVNRDVDNTEEGEGEEEEEKDISTQIQQLKTHLFNRDFESAFTDASPSLLRAYALRWSASRSLAYCGLFKGVIDCALESGHGLDDGKEDVGVLCIGGGAGAEIVALAGAWRALQDEQNIIKDTDESLPLEGVENLSLDEATSPKQKRRRKMGITAIDIAEWSDVVSRLTAGIHSPDVFGTKTFVAPLISGQEDEGIDISFQKMDILSLSEEGLKSLLHRQRVISLMFTLNELFSTSISRTTQLLLRMTDIASPGTILMVVDSPGSYSTLSFAKNDSTETQQQQRQYPMKFLLDHTLLSVAEGSWEKLVSQDSRWFRKDANHKLHYNVELEGGQGYIRLEDMRFQIHIYRRLSSSNQKE